MDAGSTRRTSKGNRPPNEPDSRFAAAGRREDQFRAGTVTLVGDRLLIVREGGEMILAPASPDGFKPIARAQILPATIRGYPAVSDGFVYVRNENTLVCLDLRK